MNTVRTIISSLILIALVGAGFWFKKNYLDDDKPEFTSLAPTVKEIQAMSELVTTKVYISDILEGNNKDYEGIWAINGDALITINLSKVTLTEVDENKKVATITLPLPQVSSARVDHERSRAGTITGKRIAILRNPKNRAKMVDDAMLEAQKLIKEAASKPEIIQNAKQQATLILENLYLKVGWKVIIRWQNEPHTPQ